MERIRFDPSSSAPFRLVLVRHGATELNEQRRYQGWSGAGLSNKGRSEVEALAEILSTEGHLKDLRRIYVSDLFRCVETSSILFREVDVAIVSPGSAEAAPVPSSAEGREDASPISECAESSGPDETPIPMYLEPRLRELNFGAFEGLTYEENLDRHGSVFQAWIKDPTASPPPDGESMDLFRKRVLSWVTELPSAGCVVAVLHGGSAGVLLSTLLEEPVPLPSPGSAVSLSMTEMGLAAVPINSQRNLDEPA